MTNSVAILNNERFLDKRGSFFLTYFGSGLHAIPAPLGHSQGADCGAPASWHACMHDGPVHRPHLPPFGPCTARSCQTMHRARERLLHGMHAWRIEFWMLTSRMLHVHVSRLPSLIKWGASCSMHLFTQFSLTCHPLMQAAGASPRWPALARWASPSSGAYMRHSTFAVSLGCHFKPPLSRPYL